jgi:ADP-ribose pyrophosphatase YjhB (NUDIX family)
MADKQTEGFLYPFPMVSATATMVLIKPATNDFREMVLLGKRGPAKPVYPGAWSLPGGFLNSMQETTEECASRETFEEVNIKIHPSRWHLFGVVSDPRIDPRAHVINACYWAELTDFETEVAKAGDDLDEIQWMGVRNFIGSTGKNGFKFGADMAFNHYDILIDGLNAWAKFRGIEV